MIFVVASIVIVLFLPIFLWYRKYYKYEKYFKFISGPKPFPILGNVWDFRTTADIIPTLMKYREQFGSLFKGYAGFKFLLSISDRKYTEFVLSSNNLIDKSDMYDTLLPWLGTGLLTSTGEKWRLHRKLLTPAFHFQILEQFIDVFNSAGDVLVQKLEVEVGKQSTDIYPLISLCALDIICESAMGTTVNAQQNSKSRYVECVREMSKIVIEKNHPMKSNKFTYLLFPTYYKEKRVLKVLHDYSSSIIKKRRQLIALASGNQQLVDEFGNKRRSAFLGVLLQASVNGKPLSDTDIREEVDTFMFEGHDTVTSAISFTLMCLAHNFNVQQKVLYELKSIFSDDFNRPVTYKDLNEMKYLEMVIKESLRLYPSVPMFGRALLEDIEFDGHVLPKGITFGIFAYALGRDKSAFPDPERFDPERFNSENMSKRGPYSYLPFSAGPRNCIGQRFAMLEMKSIISAILRNYELFPTEPQHAPVIVFETVLKSQNGIYIRLKKRFEI